MPSNVSPLTSSGRLLIGAPHKSSGKTTVTLGLCTALARAGVKVQPFKKGPDYIDPMWLARAAGRPCYNLDFNTMGAEELGRTFTARSAGADLSLVEGNMGLFDSLDVEGHQSNAALARLLGTPVILVVNTTGMTRSVAPLIRGFLDFEPEVRIAGVILNKVAGDRHERRLREAIAHYLDVPVVGAVRRDERLIISERHLGLVPSNEAAAADRILNAIADAVAPQVDLDLLRQLAATAAPLPSVAAAAPPARAADLRIGIARDAAFGFYYPSDLERFAEAGAELVPFDTLHDDRLPEVDGLFIGGGFPETQMEALEANWPMRSAVRAAIEAGLPVYAECGGLMYLSRAVVWNGRRCEMVGVVPGEAVMHERPQGKGYVRLQPTGAAPWGQTGTAVMNAHEFHYSTLEQRGEMVFAYDVIRGAGIDGRHDGFVYHNLLANYVHLQDTDSNPWTRHFVAFVRRVRDARRSAETTTTGESR